MKINVRYDLPDLYISDKCFDVKDNGRLYILKETILKDFVQFKINIPRDFENCCLWRVDSRHKRMEYLGDHVFASVLLSDEGGALPGHVIFSNRRRRNSPVKEKPKPQNAMDTLKAHKKFIKHIQESSKKKILEMLEEGLDANYTIKESGESPILTWLTAKPADLHFILKVLIDHECDIHYRNSVGETALHVAIALQKREAVGILHVLGASFDEWESTSIPALFYALDKDIDPGFFEYILDLNIPLTITDGLNRNVLHVCVHNSLVNHLSIILKKLLLHEDQTILPHLMSQISNGGNTPIHLSILMNQRSCLLEFAKLRKYLNVENSFKQTPMDLACSLGRCELIDILNWASSEPSGNLAPPNMKGTLTYAQSLIHCRSFATLLKRAEEKGNLNHSYPYVTYALDVFTARYPEEITLDIGDKISIYLILKSCVAFGSKLVDGTEKSGWFPSSAISMTSQKEISAFQKSFINLEGLCLKIPNLPPQECPTYRPLMLFINFTGNKGDVKVEIGQKSTTLRSSDRPASQATLASPFFVKSIEEYCPASLAGLRIGDTLLYIMDEDITSSSLSYITSKLQKPLPVDKQKIKNSFPLTQISLIILRPIADSNDFNPRTSCIEPQSEVLSGSIPRSNSCFARLKEPNTVPTKLDQPQATETAYQYQGKYSVPYQKALPLIPSDFTYGKIDKSKKNSPKKYLRAKDIVPLLNFEENQCLEYQ